jgi:hypothetical protein
VDEHAAEGFYFSPEILAFVKRWKTCAENNGNYVEK